jgi:hypothetical protein
VFVRGFEHTLTNNNFETNLLSTFILQVGESTYLPRNTNLSEKGCVAGDWELIL